MYTSVLFPPSLPLQAAGVRLGTLLESLTSLLLALAIALYYSWVLTLVVLGVMPLILVSSAIHFQIITHSNQEGGSSGDTTADQVAAYSNTYTYMCNWTLCAQLSLVHVLSLSPDFV